MPWLGVGCVNGDGGGWEVQYKVPTEYGHIRGVCLHLQKAYKSIRTPLTYQYDRSILASANMYKYVVFFGKRMSDLLRYFIPRTCATNTKGWASSGYIYVHLTDILPYIRILIYTGWVQALACMQPCIPILRYTHGGHILGGPPQVCLPPPKGCQHKERNKTE